jgi:ribosomal protein L28
MCLRPWEPNLYKVRPRGLLCLRPWEPNLYKVRPRGLLCLRPWEPNLFKDEEWKYNFIWYETD